MYIPIYRFTHIHIIKIEINIFKCNSPRRLVLGIPFSNQDFLFSLWPTLSNFLTLYPIETEVSQSMPPHTYFLNSNLYFHMCPNKIASFCMIFGYFSCCCDKNTLRKISFKEGRFYVGSPLESIAVTKQSL